MKILTTFLKTIQAIGASTPPMSLPPCWLLLLHSPLVFSLAGQPLGNWSLNSFLNSSLHQTCCIFKKNGQNKLFYFHMGYPSPLPPFFFKAQCLCSDKGLFPTIAICWGFCLSACSSRTCDLLLVVKVKEILTSGEMEKV